MQLQPTVILPHSPANAPISRGVDLWPSLARSSVATRIDARTPLVLSFAARDTRIPNRRSRLSRPLMFVVCAGCVLAPAVVFAHHSRANYDMTKEIVVEGTVAALAWTNPHVSMTVERQGPGGEQSRLEIELSSVSEALALGLKKEAIEPGSRVVVRAHPGRSGPGAKAVGLDVRTSDGTVYPLNIDARLAVIPAPQPASGIAGHWAPTLESYPGLAVIARPMQVSEAGRAAAAEARRASAGTGGALPCQPFPPPFISLCPDLRTIEVNDANVVMRFEGAIGVPMERVVHLDQDAHPVGVTPSLMGHSIGRWEGETLVIDTVGFTPHRFGVLTFPSGPNKHLVERLALTSDRLQLEYTFTLEDPDVLAAPFSFTAMWNHRPDLEFSGVACDPEVSRRAVQP